LHRISDLLNGGVRRQRSERIRARWDARGSGVRVEVAPAATACTHQCGAQNQTRGEAVVLGFPFPVPAASRITPALPAA
jgi:hypothetical protein